MPDLPSRPSCCGGPSDKAYCPAPARTEPFLDGTIDTPAGPVPRLATRLTHADRIGGWKVRWGIGRDRYAVAPGLYATGRPKPDSPVLVTANYKLTVDLLRSQLGGIDAWVLVLDTRGVNVWCAAGKGTFGTEELVDRLRAVKLHSVVTHRDLILPQLGAPGVAAHGVIKRTGFRVHYGPVRADDLPGYFGGGMKAAEEMRRVRFTLADRLVLAPVELTGGLKPLLLVLFAVVLASGLAVRPFEPAQAAAVALAYGGWLVLAYLAAALLVPLGLPWLPGRALALKGLWPGLLLSALCWAFFRAHPALVPHPWTTIGWMALLPAVTSFIGMNFTGATPYTSLSGVKYEMRRAVPLQVLGAVSAVVLWVAGGFLR